MSALSVDPDRGGENSPEDWPPAEFLFPPAAEPEPRSETVTERPRPGRRVARGALRGLHLLFVVVFMAALVAALVAGGLLLLTMALRAVVT